MNTLHSRVTATQPDLGRVHIHEHEYEYMIHDFHEYEYEYFKYVLEYTNTEYIGPRSVHSIIIQYSR